MSVIAVAGSSQLSSIQNQYQRIHNEFKQLEQDLQSGSHAQAQTDFVSLSQSVASQFGSASPIGQALSSIGQALQSGNLSAAQKAFASLRNVSPTAVHHHSHVPPMAGKLTQGLDQLGQALQAGDLTASQKAFAAVQQTWQQISTDSTGVGDVPTQKSPGTSVMA